MAITRIAQVDVGAGGAATISFSAIPQIYTDLQIQFSSRSNRTGPVVSAVRVTVNGSTTNLEISLFGNGATASSTGSSDSGIGYTDSDSATANTFGNGSYYFPNYATSIIHSYSGETVIENNAATAFSNILAGKTGSSAAITSIILADYNGFTFNQYSSFSLYGISKSGASGATVA